LKERDQRNERREGGSEMTAWLRIGAFVAPVSDLDRAAAFYSKLFGFIEQWRMEGLVVLSTTSGQLWLLDYGGRLEPGGRPTQLVLFVNEGVDEWEAKVRTEGCRISQTLHDDPLGRLFIFADSEDNLVEIRQPDAIVAGF